MNAFIGFGSALRLEAEALVYLWALVRLVSL
jgi:hypothetical protein